MQHPYHLFIFFHAQWTPLHRAVEKGGLDMVKFLCAHKADVNIKDKNGASSMTSHI